MISLPKHNLSEDYVGVSILDPYEVKKNLVQDEIERPQSAVSEQFLPNTKPQYSLMNPFDKEEKIIFYIDGARFLPDNVSITKVIVRIVDSKLKEQYK